jgi:hypothetical protein
MRTLLVGLVLACCAGAAVVDRVAVVVGKTVITESELMAELKMTAFMNQAPVDLSPQARREAAERLVDQELIRNEMKVGSYPQPSQKDADEMLRNFRQEHFANEGEYRAALQKYGIKEEQLKQHLLWQLAVMRFTDLRFSGSLPAPPATAGADRAVPGGEPSSRRTALPQRLAANGANRTAPGGDRSANGGNVDQQLDAWLKEARTETRIQFKKDAFQ